MRKENDDGRELVFSGSWIDVAEKGWTVHPVVNLK